MCTSCLTTCVSQSEVCNSLVSSTTEWWHIIVTWYDPYWMRIWLKVVLWFCNRVHVNHNQLDTTRLEIRNSLCQIKCPSYDEKTSRRKNINLVCKKNFFHIPMLQITLPFFLINLNLHFKDNKRNLWISRNVNLSRFQRLLSYLKVPGY